MGLQRRSLEGIRGHRVDEIAYGAASVPDPVYKSRPAASACSGGPGAHARRALPASSPRSARSAASRWEFRLFRHVAALPDLINEQLQPSPQHPGPLPHRRQMNLASTKSAPPEARPPRGAGYEPVLKKSKCACSSVLRTSPTRSPAPA